eukprot:scaffold912_cov187-Ochromonas_danica.AAC.53
MTTFFASVLRALPMRSNTAATATTTTNNTMMVTSQSTLTKGPLKTTTTAVGTVLVSMVYDKLFGYHKNHSHGGYLLDDGDDDREDEDEREEKDAIPLEIRYPEALEQSLEDVHDLAHKWQEEAEKTLKKVEESLKFSVQLQSKPYESLSMSRKSNGTQARRGSQSSTIIGMQSGKSSRSMKKEKEVPNQSDHSQMTLLYPVEEEHPESVVEDDDHVHEEEEVVGISDEEVVTAAAAAAAAIFGDDHIKESDSIGHQSEKNDSNHLEMREMGGEDDDDGGDQEEL